MKLKFLGTGTSQGVPVIGCKCEVCTSNDLRNNRFRSSVLITTDDSQKLLIDCGPDFRSQMLHIDECNIDAVLLTHEHTDHMIGLDDIRPILFRKHLLAMPIYCQERVGNELKKRFEYAFSENKYPGAPSFQLNTINNDFKFNNTFINIIKVMHGNLPILGYKFKNLAYITDASYISDEEKEKLKNLDHLIINCLRKKRKHHSHFILEDIIPLYEELQPKNMYLTHISHEFGLHAVESVLLPPTIKMAYDGLEINF